MSPMTRRNLLRSTALVPVALAAAACSPNNSPPTTSGPPSVSTFTVAIQAFGQYLAQNFLPQLMNSGVPISNNVLGTISKIISGISATANAAGVASAEPATTVLQKVEAYVNELAPVVQPFLALIPGAGPILSIAFASLPAIEALVNFSSSQLSSLVKQIAAAPVPLSPTAAGAPLSPNQALSILLQRTGRS